MESNLSFEMSLEINDLFVSNFRFFVFCQRKGATPRFSHSKMIPFSCMLLFFFGICTFFRVRKVLVVSVLLFCLTQRIRNKLHAPQRILIVFLHLWQLWQTFTKITFHTQRLFVYFSFSFLNLVKLFCVQHGHFHLKTLNNANRHFQCFRSTHSLLAVRRFGLRLRFSVEFVRSFLSIYGREKSFLWNYDLFRVSVVMTS